MAANSRTASAVQILCVVDHFDPGGTTAEVVARSLQTNPVVVRRLLKDLERAGLVVLRPGKNGGVSLALPPNVITLDRVYRAVEGDCAVFALRPMINPRCPISIRMKGLLGPVFDDAEAAVGASLRKTTLTDLTRSIS